MTTAQDALKDFDKDGNSEDIKPQTYTSNPSIRLHPIAEQDPSECVGKFITGTYLGRREAQGPNGKLVFFDVRLGSTNADAQTKKGDKYVVTPVTTGQILSLLSPSRLDRAISQLELGKGIYVMYDGMKRVKTPKGFTMAHTFTVKAKTVELTADDKEVMKRNSQVKASKEEANNVKANSEAEAEAALSQLAD